MRLEHRLPTFVSKIVTIYFSLLCPRFTDSFHPSETWNKRNTIFSECYLFTMRVDEIYPRNQVLLRYFLFHICSFPRCGLYINVIVEKQMVYLSYYYYFSIIFTSIFLSILFLTHLTHASCCFTRVVVKNGHGEKYPMCYFRTQSIYTPNFITRFGSCGDMW